MPHNRLPTGDTLSSQINEQLPEFVRADHPTFVAFLEAYYEFLELPDEALNVSFGLRDIADIDDTLEEFVRQFKEQYLKNFPEQLAIDDVTGRPLDERRIIKNIKAYYLSKGSEKAYKFLFRILYDTNVEFYYPKVDILRASDGKFIIERFMRVTTANGADSFAAVGGKIRQRSRDTGAITASAQVDRAIQFQAGLYSVTEYVVSEIFGTFDPPQRIEFEIEREDGTVDTIEENIFTVVTSIDVDDGGSGYQVGEVVLLNNATGDVGIGAVGVIDRVDGNGAILRIAVRDPGTNYLTPPTVDFSLSVGGVGAAATANLGPIFTADGFFGNNDGKLSSNKVLQDNYYYQDYSYVLKTEVTIDKWLNIIKKVIHPSGLKVFGEVTVFRCIEAEAPHETRFQAFEIPLIGHYTPYTWLTVHDLASLYPNGYDPTTAKVAEDGTGGNHIPGANPAYAGDFTVYPDLAARPTKALGSGSGPFWYTYGSPTGTLQIGQRVTGATSNADAFIYGLDTTGTKMSLWILDGEFIVGETINQVTGPAASAQIISQVIPPDTRWGFPYRPKADPIFIIYHHPNRRGMPEIPGPGETHPNSEMRVVTRSMVSGTFNVGENVIGDLTRITDITPYVLGDDYTIGETVTGGTSGASGVVLEWNPADSLITLTDSSTYVSGEDFIEGEGVTGGTSGETAIVSSWSQAASGDPGSVLVVSGASGAFTPGEVITGDTSGYSITLDTQIGGLGSELVLGQIASGPFDDGEDITGGTSGAEITVDEITEDQREGTIDADDLPSTGDSQIIMVTSGEFTVGEHIIGQDSGAVALVSSITSLVYADGMPWRDIVIRDFARNMPVGEHILCVPRDDCEVLSDAGYPNEDIGGLDGSGPTD